MLQATKWALEQSIEKWEAIVKGTGKDFRSDNCALCKRFCAHLHSSITERVGTKDECPLNSDYGGGCGGCCCWEWNAWVHHHSGYHEDSHSGMTVHKDCKSCEILAKAMLARLKKARRGAK